MRSLITIGRNLPCDLPAIAKFHAKILHSGGNLIEQVFLTPRLRLQVAGILVMKDLFDA